VARIRSLTQAPGTGRVHPSDVDAEWSIVSTTEGSLLQISTFGSDGRVSRPKVSQTIQVDQKIAEQLRCILNELFPAP
jgi:hypothetical protein